MRHAFRRPHHLPARWGRAVSDLMRDACTPGGIDFSSVLTLAQFYSRSGD